MNELVSVPISPWYTIPAAVGLLALTFVFAPGLLLHLGVLLFPQGHKRRKQFTADLYDRWAGSELPVRRTRRVWGQAGSNGFERRDAHSPNRMVNRLHGTLRSVTNDHEL